MYYVYLLASRRYGTLYLGVTNNLSRRVWEHKTKAVPGFSSKYDVDRLVWYETYKRIDEAIVREKDTKKWRRDWKIRLFEDMNPVWADLYESLTDRRRVHGFRAPLRGPGMTRTGAALTPTVRPSGAVPPAPRRRLRAGARPCRGSPCGRRR